MTKFLRVAVLALPIALLAPAPAQANPMVAVGWLWAAGAGGLLLGIVGTTLYNQNRYTLVTPAQAEPVVYQQQPGCRNVTIRIDGRARRAQLCE